MKSKTFLEMEKLLLALGDKTRLRLLNIMRESEVNVNSFVEVTGESQPKISRHLAVLRGAGIVELRREGKWVYYKIAEPANEYAALILRDALRWMNSHDEIRREFEKSVGTRGLSAKEETSQSNASAKTNIRANRELEIYLL